jgi:flagellar hook-associated protein 2
MSIVSSTGLGSGIDIQSLVSQLVTAEGQPAFNAIQRQQDAANTRLSGIGSLKSGLSDFQTAVAKLKDGNLFKTHTATSADESIVKAVSGTGSVAGTYSVEVTQLAKAQKSITTAEFANSTAVVGTGTLNFATTGGSSFSVTVDSSNNTLEGVRDAINKATGNTSISASIVNVDPGTGTGTISKLVLTAKNTGLSNGFTVSASGDSDGNDTDNLGLSRLASSNLSPQTTAADAVIKVDGQTATRSTNSITDVIQGITLNLQSAQAGTKVAVNVSLDTASVNKTLTDFVTSYNKLHTVIKGLGQYGGNTDGTGNGALIGDATLRYTSSQIRQESANIVSSATGNYNSLAMIGIKIDKDGVMALDGTQLNTALTADLQSVSDVFASSQGVAVRLSDKLTNFLQSGGPLDSQQTSLKNQLSRLATQRDDVQTRMDHVKSVMLKQFTAMDVAVGQFKSTGSFLSNWISKL